MALKYDKLFRLVEEKHGNKTAWLREQGVHPQTLNKLRKNERVTTDVINQVCALLDCQPGDIMSFERVTESYCSSIK